MDVPVQIKGKLRSRVSVAADADAATLEHAARQAPKIAEQLAGKTIIKVVVVPGRMVNARRASTPIANVPVAPAGTACVKV